MAVSIVPAHASHIDGMLDHLPAQTLAELDARGMTARGALELGLRHSVLARTALEDAAPIAMWGITATMLGDVAHPWVITTTATLRHRVRFWRETKRQVAAMLALYPVLANEFDSGDGEACRILRHLGFSRVDDNPLATFELIRA